ncbi:MAG: RNA methyltransferase [Candidatus Binataceae bacterium]
MLANFAFVLVHPQSPGNIGAAARALKNTGLRDLRLVAPAKGPEAAIMAVHARDLLERAQIHSSLRTALRDRTLTIGTTCRRGPYREPGSLREMAPGLIAAAASNRVAIIFGPEDTGLSNHELKLCQRLMTIPAAPDYSSLNLAQAVMVVAYELMMASATARDEPAPEFARTIVIDAMLERMAHALVEIGFLPEDNRDHIMFALRRLFGRSGLRPRELDILNGIANQMRWFAEGGHATIAAKRRAGLKLR